MAEETEQSEQPRGEDGRFVSSAPAADTAPAQDAPEATAPEGQPEPGGVAPAEKPEPDRDAEAFERVTAKYADADKGQTTAASPSPDGTPEPAKPETSAPPTAAEYDGLDEAGYTALKRAKMLPPKERWSRATLDEQYRLVAAARQMLSDRERQYQAARQTPPVTDPGGQAGTSGQPPAGQPLALPKDVADMLAQMDAQATAIEQEYGEAIAAPHRLAAKAQRAFYEHQTAALRQTVESIQQRETEAQRQAERAKQVAEITRLEDSVFSALKERYPMLADSRVREDLTAKARQWSILMAQQGQRYPSLASEVKATIEYVTQAEYFPQVQEQQRKKDEAARKDRLAGSVDRGTSRATTNRPRTQDEVDKDSFERLSKKHGLTAA